MSDQLPPLNERDYRILDALSEDGGFLTRQVALAATGRAGRIESAWCRNDLLHLRKIGLVTEMDREKPVVWVRTKLGTTALERRRAE